MLINKIKLNNEHWTSDYIPISYQNILSKKQYNNSYTFYWATKFNLHATCRAYYISTNRIEIGDVWLNDNMRGKKINGTKISILFMKKVIAKIWQLFKESTNISLLVSQDNIAAMKLYQKLKFKIVKEFKNHKKLKIKKGYLMIREKK